MKAYKARLDLSNKQRTACLRHAGAARFAWNWGLRKKIEAQQTGGKVPSAIDLHRELNALKKTDFPWMYEVSKCAPQEALRNLDNAFSHFFRRCKSKSPKKGYPKFKSRKRGIGTFTLSGTIKATDRSVQLPRLGELRLLERGYIPTDERIVAATVSERAGRWFVSVRTDAEPTRPGGTENLGVDVGIKHLAVLSDGTVFENPKALVGAQRRLRLLQKSVSRKVRGSKNRGEAVHRLALQHYRVACIRGDVIHKTTDAITKRAAVLGIESLNIAGMLKNRSLSRALSDASLREFHRQLEYKMEWSGGLVVKADLFYPSSKTCSRCGHVKEPLALSEREYRCELCEFVIDRDLNAAVNLRNMAASSAVTACGDRSSPDGAGPHSVSRSVKQEPNTICPAGISG